MRRERGGKVKECIDCVQKKKRRIKKWHSAERTGWEGERVHRLRTEKEKAHKKTAHGDT